MQAWQAFLLVCILSGFGVTAYQLQRTNQLNQADHELARRVAALAGDVRGPPPFGQPPGRPRFEPRRAPDRGAVDAGEPAGPTAEAPGFRPATPPGEDFHGPRGRLEEFLETREIRLSPRTLALFGQGETNDFYFVIWSRGGNPLKRSTNAPPELSRPEPPESPSAVRTRSRDRRREAFQYTEVGECVLAGRSIRSDLEATRRFALWLIVAGGGVLAVGLGGGWVLATRALRPLEQISVAASRISAGNLSERINVAETDGELGRLAGVLNSTFARLEAAFAQQRQFTADASHELRTPIAVLISETQTTLSRDRNAAEYRETVAACLDTAQQMRRLTQSLLELARYDAGQEPLERRPFDLAAQTRAGVALVRPLARERGLRLEVDLGPAEALGDADRLSRVLSNLLTNAIEYNVDGGEVRVTTRAEPGASVITIADTGQGIAAEDLPHVFERFYRADRARAPAGGHSGLGLAICKAIVDAHGGSLEIASRPGAGTVVTVKLPVP
jgi:heavy metal sensor kinase